MMSRNAVLSDPAVCRPSDGDVSSSTGTVVFWIAVPLFGTYYSPENGAVKRIKRIAFRTVRILYSLSFFPKDSDFIRAAVQGAKEFIPVPFRC